MSKTSDEEFVEQLINPVDERIALEHAVTVLEYELRNGNVSRVDNVLSLLDPEVLTPLIIIGILTITFWGKDYLTKRAEFLAKAEIALPKQLGTERAERLLQNRR